jgi:magnesium transporter
MAQLITKKPVDKLRSLLQSDNLIELTDFLDSLQASEVVYLMNKLDRKEQHKLLNAISPEDAADLIEELPDAQAADIIEEMDAEDAAAIINEMTSDERADLILELDDDEAEAILTEMTPEEAASVRRMIEYDPDTAGGLMITEYFSYSVSSTIKEVISDLKENADKYKEYHIRYIYVVSDQHLFIGVLQMQDLLLATPEQALSEIVIFLIHMTSMASPL